VADAGALGLLVEGAEQPPAKPERAPVRVDLQVQQLQTLAVRRRNEEPE